MSDERRTSTSDAVLQAIYPYERMIAFLKKAMNIKDREKDEVNITWIYIKHQMPLLGKPVIKTNRSLINRRLVCKIVTLCYAKIHRELPISDGEVISN